MIDGSVVGASLVRKEDERLVTGRGQYVDDIALARPAHVAFVRSPYARAAIRDVDLETARSRKGVIAVYSATDVNHMAKDMRSTVEIFGQAPPTKVRQLLASTEVRYVGDPVAVVVAESRYIAEDAAEDVQVDYEPLSAVVGIDAALADQELVHHDIGTNVAATAEHSPEGLEEAFEAAMFVLDETFQQHRMANVPMETHGIVAEWNDARRHLQLWAATQSAHELRQYASRLLGLPESAVSVRAQDVGGGFGQKAYVSREEATVIAVARRLGNRPVKWIEDRWENLTSAGHARGERFRVRLAFDPDHRLIASHVTLIEDFGATPVAAIGPTMLAPLMFPGPYRYALHGYKCVAVFTNTCSRQPYRGPWMVESVARESAMDIAARRLGLDPAELRRRNLLSKVDLPYVTASGMTYEDLSCAEAFDQALELAGYDEFRSEQGRARAEGRLLGIGLSSIVEPTAGPWGAFGIEVAQVRIQPGGAVDVYTGTGSHGQSIETTMAQVVAGALGVSPDHVSIHQGDTDTTPFGGGTGGSRTAVLAGAACRIAADRVKEKLVDIAAHLLEAAPEDIVVSGGILSVAGTPARSVTFAEVAWAAYVSPGLLPPGMEPGLEATARYSASRPTMANATHVSIVEVDARTGSVRVLRHVVSEDCGVVINPNVVDGQIAGGVVQGIGGVILEHADYDADGNPLATTFMDYLIPTSAEVPPIDSGHIETPASSPGGHKGVGEGGTVAAPAAVINAIADALSCEIYRQPLGPMQVLALLDASTV